MENSKNLTQMDSNEKNNNDSCTKHEENYLLKSEVERYCRQMILPEILTKGQLKLKNSRVLVIGAGGLGCPCIMYLSGAGVGEIGVVDGDYVDTSNLHRQVIHSTSNKGMNKAASAALFVKSFNPNIKITEYHEHLRNSNAVEIAEAYDVIIDCSDNPSTRYLINDTAVVLNKPLVSGSAIRWQGQLTIYNRNTVSKETLIEEGGESNCCEKKPLERKKLPCYRCLFPVPSPSLAVGSCSEEGVLGPVPGMIGVLQATEAIKILLGYGDTTLSERMLVYDSMEMTFKTFKIKGWKKDCSMCGENAVNNNKEFIKNFDYDDFASPKLCRVAKRANIPKENNITWKELIEYRNKEEEQVENIKSNDGDQSTLGKEQIGKDKESSQTGSTVLDKNCGSDNEAKGKDVHSTEFENKKESIILLDVRTKEQFDLFNFTYVTNKSKVTQDSSSQNTGINCDEEPNVSRILNCKKLLGNKEYLNIPLEKLKKDFEDLEKQGVFNTNKNIFITCRSGMKSTYAVEHFLKHGYSKVYNVVDGMHGYIQEMDNQNIPFY